MKFIELFAGIGGFRFGLEKANTITQSEERESKEGRNWSSDIKRTRLYGRFNSPFTCVWANEWDKYACQISRKHYPDEPLIEGDIRAVDPATIPKHDLITAGFPCQSFSIAGKRGGFEDTRGTLFFEICRIARAKRTPYLLLENVKGLLSNDEGDTFQTILRTLDELGYDLQWQVLNSKNFGVPQNRERVFVIGYLRGQPRPKVFPLGETDSEINQNNKRNPTTYAIDSNYGKGLNEWGKGNVRTIIHTAYPGEIRKYQKTSPTISTPSGGGHLPMVVHKTSGQTVTIKENEIGALQAGGSNVRDKVPNVVQLSPAIRAEHHNTADVHYLPGIRRLTPLECERLQGFPDGWTEGISDTQRYKCLGNAVTTNVIEAIGRQWING